MALPGNHANAEGGQGGSALGGSDKLPEPPPFAPPSLVRRYYLRAQHQYKLELQDNVRITAADRHTPDRFLAVQNSSIGDLVTHSLTN